MPVKDAARLSPLSLLMLGILLANNIELSGSFHDLAIFADGFYG